MTLTGGAMFVGLMVGGVLADRYERKSDFAGAWHLWHWLHWTVPECAAAGAVFAGNLFTWFMGWFFASLGVTALLAATPALVGRENLMQAGAITMLTVRLGSVISPMIGGLLLATGGVARNYRLAAAGTLLPCYRC